MHEEVLCIINTIKAIVVVLLKKKNLLYVLAYLFMAIVMYLMAEPAPHDHALEEGRNAQE